jgi:hypothetical protein
MSASHRALPYVLVLVLGAGLTLGACAHTGPASKATPKATPNTSGERAPELLVEQPRAGALVRAAEVTVTGRVRTYDGRAWVHVDSISARVDGDRFVAEHVPLREDQALHVDLADGHGRHAAATIALIAESPDRPRSDELCTPALDCLRYEVRGRPHRNAAGKVDNAVLVLPAFGLDERLDELWPDLIGPGRALDPRERYLIGIGPATTRKDAAPAAPIDDPDAIWLLIAQLATTLELDPEVPVIGVSYGGELALHGLASGALRGPLLLGGAHDRPFDEPAMQALRAIFLRSASKPKDAVWASIAHIVVPATYGAAYLADPQHAIVHGLVEEARVGGLQAALERELVAHFAPTFSTARLAARVERAYLLKAQPLDYPSLTGRHVILVANKPDGLAAATRVHGLALRLRSSGAAVTMVELDDERGHAAFFLGAPLRLEAAVRALFAPPRGAP